MLYIGVLGPAVATEDGAACGIPAGKTTELLCRLAMTPGMPVRADALIEDLWGMPVAKNTLQAKVSQLRSALGDKDLVRGVGDSYVLVVDPSNVDASQVAALARSASAALAAHEPTSAARDAQVGLALFRGDPLSDAGEWAAPYRSALEQVRWGLLEDAMAARVDLGAGSELVAELQHLVEQQPLRERLWASLLTALYRSGRQADALAAYRKVRRHLAHELGVDPGPDLRAVEERILVHSPELDICHPAVALVVPGNLPESATPLLGREAELAEIAERLDSSRLLTLIGTAGVGKTRLALEAARTAAPPGGAWLVRLDAVDADAELLHLLTETMHVAGGEADLLQRLELQPSTLLVLDGCEHLRGSVAALARVLLDNVPRIRLLATSQVGLGLEQEHLLAVGPLAPDDSVALFRLHAHRHRHGALDGRDDLVADVCRALDGLPLAIELAAARIRSLSLEDIARRLDDRFTLLRDPHSTRPDRRHALDAALGWSYDLLFPDDQRGLWALSCFTSGATLSAAETTMAALEVPGKVALDTIGRLVDRSLASLDDATPVARYRLLDSVRAFAGKQLQEAGLLEVAMAAHARWYCNQADRCRAEIRSAAQPKWLDFVRAERADVDSALTWCAQHDPATGARIALGFGWAWAVLGDGAAGAARLRAAVGPDEIPTSRIEAALVATWLEASAGDLTLAGGDLQVAAALAQALGDPRLAADVDWYRAFLAIQQGRAGEVQAAARRATQTYRELGLDWETAAGLLVAAYGDLMLGDVATAAIRAQEALSLLEDSGDGWGLLHAQGILGGVAEAGGRLGSAQEAYERAADTAHMMGFLGQAALHRASWARVTSRAGSARTQQAYETALAEAMAAADARLAASLRLHLAQVLRRAGDNSAARDLLRANARFYAHAGGGDLAHLNKVLLAAIDDDVESLQALGDEAAAVSDIPAYVASVDALARIAAQAGDPQSARKRLTSADSAALEAVTDYVERTDAEMAHDLLDAPT